MAGPECVAGWLLKYLISSSKVAANEVFAALANETLREGEGGAGCAGAFWETSTTGSSLVAPLLMCVVSLDDIQCIITAAPTEWLILGNKKGVSLLKIYTGDVMTETMVILCHSNSS